MFYQYDEKNSIEVPEPYHRFMTPIFMGDDETIKGCAFSCHMTEWPAGCEIDSHSHPAATEAMFVISGNGKCSIDHVEHEFVPGSMIVAPPGIEHKIVNTGDEMLKVFCVFSPPVTGASLRERAMAALQETRELIED